MEQEKVVNALAVYNPYQLPDGIAGAIIGDIVKKAKLLRAQEDDDEIYTTTSAISVIAKAKMDDYKYSIWESNQSKLAEQIATFGDGLGKLDGWSIAKPMYYQTQRLPNGDTLLSIYVAVLAEREEDENYGVVAAQPY